MSLLKLKDLLNNLKFTKDQDVTSLVDIERQVKSA